MKFKIGDKVIFNRKKHEQTYRPMPHMFCGILTVRSIVDDACFFVETDNFGMRCYFLLPFINKDFKDYLLENYEI